MLAQNVQSQQTSDGFRSSIFDSSFCAKNYSEADIMSGVKGRSGVYKRTKPIWNKGKKCPQFAMENNGSWKGGRVLRGGYWSIKLPNHPMADKQGYIKEHRLIMEKHLGRYLTKEEVVHHINRNIKDNRIENLKLFKNQSEHKKYEDEFKK